MKTEEILKLDCKKKENIEKIKKCLNKIFKEENIKINRLEKYVFENCNFASISICNDKNEKYYSMHIENNTIVALSLYELFAKTTILLFSKGKNKK